MKKDKTSIEVKLDSFKVLIRVPKGTSMLQMKTVAEAIKAFPIVFIPEGFEVIVINKDGTSKKL